MRTSLVRVSLLVLAFMGASPAASAAPLPISGLAGASFRASDLAAMRDCYGRRAGFREVKASQPGAARFAVGANQWIEFEPGALKEYVVRFLSLSLTTPSLQALRSQLRDRGVESTPIAGGLEVRDPGGNALLFRQATDRNGARTAKASPGFSQHLQHVGLVMHHDLEEPAQRFYGQTLGLQEVFRMNDKGGRPTLIKYRLPGHRADIIELIFVWGPLNKWAANSAYHMNFAVDDIRPVYCDLFARGLATEDRHFPQVNAERLWAIDMIDPEFTRVEIQVTQKAEEEIGATLNLPCARAEEPLALFNGKDLKGWRGEEGYWRVDKGEIVGTAKTYMHYNSFLWHDTAVLKDFYLSVWIKQTPPRERNSGIQFRSRHINGGNHALGYQADVGTGLWGRLYHEEGREHLFVTDAGENAVKWDDWNHYEVLAVGHRVWTAVNGTVSVSVEDPKGELAGKLALQIHFGGPQEVRYRGLKVVRNPKIALAGLDEPALVRLLKPALEIAKKTDDKKK